MKECKEAGESCVVCCWEWQNRRMNARYRKRMKYDDGGDDGDEVTWPGYKV